MTQKVDRTSAYSSSTQEDYSESLCRMTAVRFHNLRMALVIAVSRQRWGNNHRELSNPRPHSPSIICVGVLVGLAGS